MNILLVVYTAVDILLSGAIAVLLYKRKLLRRLPLFFCYAVYSGCDVIVRSCLLHYGGNVTYFFGYWYSEIGEIVLALLAVRESMSNMFRGFETFAWFGWIIRLSVWVALGYGILKVVLQPPKADWLVSLVVSTELIFQYWLMSAVLLFFILAWVFGIPVNQRESWVILGFLIESVLIVSGLLLRSLFGTRFVMLSSVVPGMSYLIGKVVWLVGMMKREKSFYVQREPGPYGPGRVEMMASLESYMEVLRRVLRGR